MASLKLNLTKNNWTRAADTMYNSIDEIKKYQKAVKKNKAVAEAEQDWVDEYFQPITDLVTSQFGWSCMAQFTELFGIEGMNRRSVRHIKPNPHKCQAHFSGLHWNSRRMGEKDWFDPYHEYQIRGTNQFCGVFSMMYLLDLLPEKIESPGIEKYYIYAQNALRFCKQVIEHCVPKGYEDPLFDITRKEWTRILKEALKHPYRFINMVETNPDLIN